jgi:hypothetical protein
VIDCREVHTLQSHCHNGSAGNGEYDFPSFLIRDRTQGRDKQRVHAFVDFVLDENPRYDHGDSIHSYILSCSEGKRMDLRASSYGNASYSEAA